MKRYIVLDRPPPDADPAAVYLAIRKKAIWRGDKVMQLRSPHTFRMLAALFACSGYMTTEDILEAYYAGDDPVKGNERQVWLYLCIWRKKLAEMQIGVDRRHGRGYLICDHRRV